MINDPYELMLPPGLEHGKEEEEEEPRKIEDFFYDDIPSRHGRNVDYGYGAHVQVCRFDDKGNHVSMSRDCPHFLTEDQEGRNIHPGWTVQSNR